MPAKPRPESARQQAKLLLEMLYTQSAPGLAVGTSSAARLHSAIRAVVRADRLENPGAWPGLRVFQSNNPMELFICRDPSASGSSEP